MKETPDNANADAEMNRALQLAMLQTIRLAHEQSSTCSTLLQRTADALVENNQDLAMSDILEAEPLLYEAHILLNAISIVRRNANPM